MSSLSNTSVKTNLTSTFAHSSYPTPDVFDVFIPWMAKQWQVPIAIQVINVQKDEGITKKPSEVSAPRKTSSMAETRTTTSRMIFQLEEKTIIIKTYYDKNKLSEIEIIPSELALPRKIIHLLIITLPYHTYCYKLSLNTAKIDASLLYDIGKLLLLSNLTEVYLDGTVIAEGNYYILLDKECKLQHLSLNWCKINDIVCERIASKLAFGCPAEKTLKILSLSSNFICDEGAKSLGTVLRSNRTLIHLNLCNNKITDEGIRHILSVLMEFPLTYDEIIGKRTRHLNFSEKKLFVYRKCLADILAKSKPEMEAKKGLKVRRRNSISSIPSITQKVDEDGSLAEKMCKDIVGEWQDVFNSKHTIVKNEYLYCIGNFGLCSLNIAYNNFEYRTVKMLHEVLKYQDANRMNGSGLLRLVIEGNNIPDKCMELDEISELLNKAVDVQLKLLAVPRRKTLTSTTKTRK